MAQFGSITDRDRAMLDLSAAAGQADTLAIRAAIRLLVRSLDPATGLEADEIEHQGAGIRRQAAVERE